MDLEEAKAVITVEADTPIGRLLLATNLICSRENVRKVTFADILGCMRRGNKLGRRTAIDELAAIALYSSTERKRSSLVPYRDFVTDPNDWETYLKVNGFI